MAGERGFAQAGRAVEQHVVHGFAAQAGGLDGDGQVLFQLVLAGEVGQAARTEAGFELRIFGLPCAGNQFPVGHSFSAYRTSSRARRKSGSNSVSGGGGAPAAAALRTAASAAGRAQPRFSSAESTS